MRWFCFRMKGPEATEAPAQVLRKKGRIYFALAFSALFAGLHGSMASPFATAMGALSGLLSDFTSNSTLRAMMNWGRSCRAWQAISGDLRGREQRGRQMKNLRIKIALDNGDQWDDCDHNHNIIYANHAVKNSLGRCLPIFNRFARFLMLPTRWRSIPRNHRAPAYHGIADRGIATDAECIPLY